MTDRSASSRARLLAGVLAVVLAALGAVVVIRDATDAAALASAAATFVLALLVMSLLTPLLPRRRNGRLWTAVATAIALPALCLTALYAVLRPQTTTGDPSLAAIAILTAIPAALCGLLLTAGRYLDRR